MFRRDFDVFFFGTAILFSRTGLGSSLGRGEGNPFLSAENPLHARIYGGSAHPLPERREGGEGARGFIRRRGLAGQDLIEARAGGAGIGIEGDGQLLRDRLAEIDRRAVEGIGPLFAVIVERQRRTPSSCGVAPA